MGKIHLRENSMPSLIVKYLKENKACVLSDAKDYLGIQGKRVAVVLSRLVSRGFIRTLSIKTHPKIYYIEHQSYGWDYGIQKGIIPKTIPKIMGIISDKGFVTNLELLYSHDVSRKDIGFFRKNVIPFLDEFKSHYHQKIDIFYLSSRKIESIMNTQGFRKVKKLQSKIMKERQRTGKNLEKIVKELLTKMGFDKIQEQVYIFDPIAKRKVFFDFIAKKHLDKKKLTFPVEVLIECKNTMNPISSYDVLRMVTASRNLFGFERPIWIFALSGSSYWMWQLMRSYENVQIYDYHALKKMCLAYGVEGVGKHLQGRESLPSIHPGS